MPVGSFLFSKVDRPLDFELDGTEFATVLHILKRLSSISTMSVTSETD